MSTKAIESDLVRNAARGAWLSILDFLAPELERAISKPGRHIGCPVHGGKDGFKLFRDADLSGGGICNSCGAKPDGFSLLMWLRGWSFPDALKAVANVLGISADGDHQKPGVVQRPVFTKSKSTADDDRIKAIHEITAIVDRHGTILNFQKFSDLVLSLLVEIESSRIGSLYNSLKNILILEGSHNTSPGPSDGFILFINITFSKGTGDLEIEVPNIPE